ncbi:MAG: acetate/propionate family kinase [Betaproteobacteria bacterium]|jgi:acetate kinase|nr:acetate/propionate family kinase [Rhodocyclaceae bacterium]MCA3134247.1 acetate/propionate family kinase [Rhodocyclaceae bacterium]MCA3146787.1 acetate/propionate family kinase [Rhodocyclaceae bacterium]
MAEPGATGGALPIDQDVRPAGAILVLNAGSSSLKFGVHGADGGWLLRGRLDRLGDMPRLVVRDAMGRVTERRWPDPPPPDSVSDMQAVLALVDEQLPDIPLAAVGHRVVHGGRTFAAPVRVDAAILEQLERFEHLAPLHQPHNLAPIRRLLARRPALPQVACFDTAFHASNPPVEQRYALPAELHEAGVQRYGFHGLSYEYIAGALPALDGRAADGRTVVLHLGNGASMCALRGGHSVATTMGFTALEGLPMGTRSGALDPGVLLWLMDERGMDARALEDLLYRRSGLLGVSGLSADMATLLSSPAPAAALAIDLFVYRIGRELGSLAAALGGLDALVFTAGIGENAAAIRARVCEAAAWLGVEVDPAANAAGGARISSPSSSVSAWVLPTDEEAMIARHVRELLSGSQAPPHP